MIDKKVLTPDSSLLEENDRVSLRVSELAGIACAELFNAYGVELKPHVEEKEPERGSESPMLSGVMGFVGPHLRGTCLLASSAGPVQASCPVGGKPRDWVGELTNQLVGRLKTKLIARGVEVFMTTPIVLTGTSIRPIPRGPLTPTKFCSDFGSVFVWVEAESGSDLVLGSILPGLVKREGEILIF